MVSIRERSLQKGPSKLATEFPFMIWLKIWMEQSFWMFKICNPSSTYKEHTITAKERFQGTDPSQYQVASTKSLQKH